MVPVELLESGTSVIPIGHLFIGRSKLSGWDFIVTDHRLETVVTGYLPLDSFHVKGLDLHSVCVPLYPAAELDGGHLAVVSPTRATPQDQAKTQPRHRRRRAWSPYGGNVFTLWCWYHAGRVLGHFYTRKGRNG